jgi:hypothetical protein
MDFPGLGEALPESEDAILALAMRMIEAMEREPDRFRRAPHSAGDLRAAVEKARAALAASDAAEAAQREALTRSEQALRALKDGLQRELWSVEVEVRGEREKLSGLGWGGSEATDRVAPGAPRDLTIGSQHGVNVVLEWRPPADGGPAAAYRVQRRKAGRPWRYVATAEDNACLLSDQPLGIEMDYRVAAVNKAGTGPPSATVTVLL